MVMPNYYYRETPTGRVRGRRTWRNKIVMQIEIKEEELAPWGKRSTAPVLNTTYLWRDATVDDLPMQIYGIRDPNLPEIR